jgi:mannose/cellobiose epimerase-like protein (N-acyl-D-glucosamine 2-epimerase family)
MSVNDIQFSFSDTVLGYVVSYDENSDYLELRTSDGRPFHAWLTGNAFAQITRNFGESYRDATGDGGGVLRDKLVPGQCLFAYGINYPEAGAHRFEVKSIHFPGDRVAEYVFEEPDWWVNEARAIADFYLRGQFPDGKYDWRNYRTKLSLSGTHTPDYIAPDFRQETDTVSRLVYGLASAYLLTGEERFLEAAESGTKYLRDNMRGRNDAEGIVFWYHGVDISPTGERHVYSSEFGDDFDAIAMYEQIYALAGPTQTYRITGDKRILSDIDRTVTLFDRFFKDPQLGGYFSHVDPVTLDPRSGSLGHNRARKNWNSVGDHAPAYLINAVLATGRKDLEDFLVTTGDTIVERFPDYETSPFVQERFHEDWSHDVKYKWQQNNAVVGHNLKIAWNLTRIHNRRPNQDYVELAKKIAGLMPSVGSDTQRGGWYDVVERILKPGQEQHRFVWHDRKAWWQQEQAILCYLILYGTFGDPEHQRYAREAAAFYNAMFLDTDEGGVYFNVLASGLPFLLGTERLKGSHSMSGYHSIELCYLAAVYTNLLIRKQPLTLHFKPMADAFPDNILRVAPDMLPPGSIRLTDVWVDDEVYTDFDADALTVNLPPGREVRVRVRITPTGDVFDYEHDVVGASHHLTLKGAIPKEEVPVLARELNRVLSANPARTVLLMHDLNELSPEAINELLFFRSKLDVGHPIFVVAPNPQVQKMFDAVGDRLKEGRTESRSRVLAATGDFRMVEDVASLPPLS